ncbi:MULTISPECIES: polysaccharide deacetylase family protein [Clostridium]|uniref:Polysaccharide deacetylase n=1 Tax=Clostridium cibarium TaxID=2762247 RepID=A0ABR8PX57_9CLOT|nr:MULTISPECIES: polysaccharide deacetylase family protein [Clostridium]MBD7912761.1 polysaccharide deacetylase [Clostridium cibarium]
MFKKNRRFISIFLTVLLVLSQRLVPTYASEANPKIIYLTFDDGPGGKVTEATLDILKREEVPATFFLIGNQIKGQEQLLIRMKNEGHSLGLHSMSHDRCKLYSCNTSFLNEMLEVKAYIKEVTGEDTNILRFPFGCNNSTFTLKPELVNLLHQNNFKIYDWNVDTTDGANFNSPPTRFTKNARSDKDVIFLLMHCGYANKNSPKALPEIIKYYKDKGYVFKPITSETEEFFHYIKK